MRADDDNVLQIPQALAGDRIQLWEQRFADHDDARARVVQDVLVVRRFPERAGGNRYGADLYGAEERVDELGTVEKEQHDPLLDADVESLTQHVARAVDALEHLCIGDSLVAAFDRDFGAPPFSDVTIDEPAGGVERIRQREHAFILSRVVNLDRIRDSGFGSGAGSRESEAGSLLTRCMTSYSLTALGSSTRGTVH